MAVSLNEFQEWVETTILLMAPMLPTFLHVLFTFFAFKDGHCAYNNGNGISIHDNGEEGEKEPCFPSGVTPLWIPHLMVDQDSAKPISSTNIPTTPSTSSSSSSLPSSSLPLPSHPIITH